MKIGDVVELNRTGKFERAIQLGMFREPEQNRNLCSWFVYTVYTNDTAKEFGSVEWLVRLRRGLQLPETGSITCLIANYGHGKSHFGVVAANCFGMEHDSEEFRQSMVQLRHSAPNEADAFEDFRTGLCVRPYFVLCLQGDNMPTLRQAVFQEVEKELLRHTATREIKPPLWHEDALAWLGKLSADKTAGANRWLEAKGWDLRHLETRLRDRDARPELRERCRELSLAVEGHTVDFGAESSVQDLLQWVLDALCIADGPFSGLVVLFDEFHAFIDSYAKAPETGNPLQNLLNVFELKKNHGRSLFCALSTMDPLAAAQTALRRSGGDPQNITKELNRIGMRSRFKCEMEVVLDSMLQQQESAWPSLWDDCQARFARANGVVRRAFKPRFDDLDWNEEEVFERITKGSFPLHPLTTCLLANLRFEAVQNPRSVLGFVQDQYKDIQDQEAVIDGCPNWVYGIDCFDEFYEMFPEKQLSRYRAVDDRLGQDATDEQRQVLMAMLLILAGRLMTMSAGYENVVAELTGINVDTSKRTLEELHRNGYIEWDPLRKGYSLAEVGQAKADFRKAVNAVRAGLDLRQFTAEGMTDRLRRTDGPFNMLLQPCPVNVEWGEKGDWAFSRYLVTKAQMTSQSLERILRLWNRDPEKGTKGWERAIELVFVPENVEDVLWAEEQGPQLLVNSAGITKPPILLSVLKTPDPALLDSLLDFLAADSIPDQERSELGDQYTRGRAEVTKALSDAGHKALFTGTNFNFVVAPTMKESISALDTQNADFVRKRVLQISYDTHVPKFSSNSAVGANNHRIASIGLAQQLLSGNVSDYLNPNGTQRQAADLVQKYLFESWGLVDDQYRLQYPSCASVSSMWDILSQDVNPAVGMAKFYITLTRLANPPFGLDTCTLALVVSGWLGWNRSKLKLFDKNGQQLAWDALRNHQHNGYLEQISSLRIRRQDEGELRRTVENILKNAALSKTVDQTTAQDWINTLEEYTKIAEDGEEFKEKCSGLLERLSSDLRKAGTYSSVRAKVLGIRPSNDLKTVYELIDQLPKVEIGIVSESDWELPSKLYTDFIDSISKWIPDLLMLSARVKSKDQVGLVRERIRSVKNRFEKAGVSLLVRAADTALEELERTNTNFDRDIQQRIFRSRIRDCKPQNLSLKVLREVRQELRTEYDSLGVLPDNVRTEFELKLAAIDTEIAGLVVGGEAIRVQLDGAKNFRNADRVLQECEKYEGRLLETSELKLAHSLMRDVDSTCKLFREVEASVEPMPQGKEALLRSFSIVQQVMANPPTQGLREYAEQVLARLDRELEKRQAEARKRYEGHVGVLNAKRPDIDDIEEARRYLRKQDEFLPEELVVELGEKIKAIEVLLETRTVEHIKSMVKKIKDKTALKDLFEYIRQLAGDQ